MTSQCLKSLLTRNEILLYSVAVNELYVRDDDPVWRKHVVMSMKHGLIGA